jgi:LacI family transcriptional regulator
VSPTTVSLVMNGKAGISEETRARVMQAASRLNYAQRQTQAARKNARLGTLRFLKIAKHGHTVNRDHNTFISDYIDGMSRQASALGFKLEVISYEGETIENIVASISSASIDGLVVLGTELDAHDLAHFQSLTVPKVVIDTFIDVLECNFVNMNNKDAVYKIISHFVKQGFRHIGFISSNVATINFRLRKEAFIEGMKSFGLAFNQKDIVTVDSTYEGAYHDMRNKLANGLRTPECYFCANDIIAYGCIKALQEFGIAIPQDLSIIGFDNLPMSAAMTPALTTIDVSKKNIGYLAIKVLDEIINSREKQPAVKILVGADMVLRSSVMPVPRKPGKI